MAVHAFLTRLGAQLRGLREARGLALAEVARRAEVSRRYLTEAEAGRANPSVEVLRRLAAALETSAAELLAGAEGGHGGERIALVGLRGAGKTSLGRLLARGDRPQFIPLRKVLARDMERLKATPSIDVVGLALKLDQVSALVDSVPLVIDERLNTAATPSRPADEAFWARFAHEAWDELKSLVRIQVMDRPDPGLVSPTQAFFLRENLKLRLLNARLALMARNDAVYRQDLRNAQAWVDRWFDARAKQTQAMQSTLRQLAAASVHIEIPTIAESLNAVRNYKIVRDRGR